MAINGVLQLNETPKVGQTSLVQQDDPAKIGNQLNGSNTSVDKVQNTSKVDKLLEKVCAEFAKLGLTPEQLRQSNIVARVSGMNEAQIENASEEELNRIYECIKAAIKDSVVGGKVDLEKAIKLGNKYNIALLGDWKSIDEFKKANEKNQEDLSARMERFFGLKKGSFANLPQEKIKEYLKRYFEGYFLERVKKSNNPAREYKIQLQDFSKLLINTPDEQKGIFRQALISLQASNRVKGLDAVLKSFGTQQARTEWADGCDTKFTKAFATEADCEGNVPEQKDVTAAVAKLTEQKSEEGIKKHQADLQQEAVDFFEKNKEALAKIKEKEIKKEPLTEEEKRLVLLRDNYFTAAKAGEMAGTALNQVIAAEVRDNLLDKMNRDAYELPIYQEVIEQVTQYVENNDNLALDDKTLTTILDKATNGNYTEVLTNHENATINAPSVAPQDKGDAASSTGCGMVQNQDAATISTIITSKEEKERTLRADSDDSKATKFTVEFSKSEVRTVAQAKQLSGSFTKVIEDFKQYGDQVIEDAAKTVAQFGKSAQVYYANLCGMKKFRDAIADNNGGWSLSQVSKLNLSFSERKDLTKKAEEKQNNKPQVV